MEDTEIEKLADLEEKHWWYRERRSVLGRQLRRLGNPGLALDIGAAAGGNTRILMEHGWTAVALDASEAGTRIGHRRGISVVQGDGTRLPFASASLDLIVAYDVLEHISDDGGVVREVRRVLKPGGKFLVAVPADPGLWSAHDEAVLHLRRYTPATLSALIRDNGFAITDQWYWNVLMRPALKLRRRRLKGSDLDVVAPWLTAILTGIIRLERYLPLSRLPGISLFLEAHPVPMPVQAPTSAVADGAEMGWSPADDVGSVRLQTAGVRSAEDVERSPLDFDVEATEVLAHDAQER